MKRRNIISEILDEPIHFPGMPSLIVTRITAYVYLKQCGMDPKERGIGSLDCLIMLPPQADEELTDDDTRERILAALRPEYEKLCGGAAL